MTCAFCDNTDIAERTVAQNDLAFAFLSNIPIVPGHVLISPKRHVQYYEDCTPNEQQAIELLRQQIKTALQKVFDAQGFNYAWNENSIAGQSVPHVHLHVVPRTQGDAGVHNYEPRQFLYRPGSRVQTPKQELLETTQLLQQTLSYGA